MLGGERCQHRAVEHVGHLCARFVGWLFVKLIIRFGGVPTSKDAKRHQNPQDPTTTPTSCGVGASSGVRPLEAWCRCTLPLLPLFVLVVLVVVVEV